MPQEQCGGLTNDLYLCRRAFVMITHNLCPQMGLADGSTGFVVDIQFRDEDDPKTDLPYCIWVEIDAYSGESFFEQQERRKWVPILPKVERVSLKSSDDSGPWCNETRTMLPLRLAWAWTVWKAQGQTLREKVVIDQGPSER